VSAPKKKRSNTNKDDLTKSRKKLENRDARTYRMVPIQPHDHNTPLDYKRRTQIPEKVQYWDLFAWMAVFVFVWLVIFIILYSENPTIFTTN
jgi:hypothetical protein